MKKIDRRRIYLDAAFMMQGSNVCCYAINAAWKNKIYDPCDDIHNNEILRNFPEFALFEPYAGSYNWFIGVNIKEAIISRINILLLCAEMCKSN